MNPDPKKTAEPGATTGVSITGLPDGKVGEVLADLLSKNGTVEDALKAAKRIRLKYPYRGINWLIWNAAVDCIEFALENGDNLSGFLKQGENIQDRDPSKQ